MGYMQSKAIMLSKVNYSDTSLIIKCLTNMGLRSFLLKGVRYSRKTKFPVAYFQALSQLNIVFSDKNNQTLNYLKEVSAAYTYQSLCSDFQKIAVSFYLNELLNKILREEEQDSESLLDCISKRLQWLDSHPFNPNFHLIFTLELTHHLGFSPTNNYSVQTPFFDLQEGIFVSNTPHKTTENNEIEKAFAELLQMDYKSPSPIGWTGKLRSELLRLLLKYHRLHTTDFGTLKSLEILPSLLV